MIPVVALLGLLTFGMLLVIHGTVVKNRWGINLNTVSCPRCKTSPPKIRKPQSVRQAGA